MLSLGFWEVFGLASCTRLESLDFSWFHDTYGTHEVQVPETQTYETFSTLLASTPPALNRLRFTLPHTDAVQNLATFASILRSLAPRIEQAVQRHQGLRTITVRVMGLFAADECTRVMDTARSTLPTRLLDSGVLQIELRISPFCKSCIDPYGNDGRADRLPCRICGGMNYTVVKLIVYCVESIIRLKARP